MPCSPCKSLEVSFRKNGGDKSKTICQSDDFITIPLHKMALRLMQKMRLRHKESNKARDNSTRPTSSIRQSTVKDKHKPTINTSNLQTSLHVRQNFSQCVVF